MIAVDAVIVTAMPDESAAFLSRADVVGDPTAMGHAEHRLLTICGRQVLLVQCGIGLVNSATAAAVAIQCTHPRAVISAGSAGACPGWRRRRRSRSSPARSRTAPAAPAGRRR